MLDYISKQIQERMGVPKESVEEQQMNEAVLECAHLMGELDELTMEGTNVDSARPFTKIDIPLSDDIEIDTVEMNLLDGRITNVPADATTAQEAMLYTRMKTLDDFVQEAYAQTSQYVRETDTAYETRVQHLAEQKYDAYKAYIIQEGMFGYDKMSVNDPSVPTRLTMSFGKLGDTGSDYFVKLPVKFEVKNNQILRKQLHGVHSLQQNPVVSEKLRQVVYEQFGQRVGASSPDEIWDKITPVEIVVPAEPADRYCEAFGFEIEGSTKTEYVVMTESVKIENQTGGEFTVSDTPISCAAVTKTEAVQEMAVESPKRKLSRFFQEAIDFGEPDAAPAADEGAPSVSVDAAPPAEGDVPTAEPAEGDLPADGSDIGGNPEEGQEKANPNDVSAQIADKVANDAAAENGESDGEGDDINIDDLDLSGADTSTDAPSDAEVDAELGDTPADGETPEDMGDTTEADVDNMTIDELLEQGTERLKGMTIQQLKDFLGSGEVPDGSAPAEEATQEAFLLTRGNIAKELDIHLRKALGILNNDDMEINDLCKAFRKEGKQLNRVLHKAAKMKKVFDESQVKQLQKTNHTLSDLLALMRADIEPSGVMVVKRLIQAFLSDATAIFILIERAKEEPVQEAFSGSSTKSKRSKEELFRGLNDDRAKLLKKNGLFDKIFGKIFGKKDEESAKKNESRSDGLPENFPITADELNKILKIIEDKTKKPCARLSWSKTKTNQDAVKPTSSVVGGIPPFIGEIPVDNEGKQLRFIIQINFSDVHGIPGLPSSGIMQFWFDRYMDTWSRSDKRQSDTKYRVLYYSLEDMKAKDRTAELRDQIDTSIYKDRESTHCFGDQTDVYLISFSKEENCLAPWSWDEVDDYDVLFMDAWNDVISDPEKKIKDVKEVYDIRKKIPKGFSDQTDCNGLFDPYGGKIGGYPGFIQGDFRDSEFTSDNTFLLLQLDCDHPFTWGDCGNAQIFITKEALAKCDFSKAIFDWACY